MKGSLALGTTFLGLFLGGCASRSDSVMNPADRQQAASGASPQYTNSSPSSSGSYPSSAPTSQGAAHNSSPGLLSPASTGSITARADPNNNTLVEVKVDHLPPPGNIEP